MSIDNMDKKYSGEIFGALSFQLNKIINAKAGYPWVSYNAAKRIGFLSGILNDNDFKNIDEYRDYYYEHHLNANALMEYSELIFKDIGFRFEKDGVTPQAIYQYLDDLIFAKTWKGIVVIEECAIRFLSRKGCSFIRKVIEVDGSYESKYSIDLFAYRNGVKFGIQVKPGTFRSHKYKDHYIRNLENNLLYMTKFRNMIKVMVYLYFSDKGRHLESRHFKLEDIECELRRHKEEQ